jgi:hypothetical protein
MIHPDDQLHHLHEIVTLLERTMEARQALIDQLSQVAARGLDSAEETEWASLQQQFADLTREQLLLLARLRQLLPPDELGDEPGDPSG